MRCAVFSCLGLGDGLITLVLSNNLHLNGASVTTFHPFLSSLQPWFPHLPLSTFPDEIETTLEKFDQIFLFFERLPRMQAILKICLEKYRHKTTILNPIATANRDYPYWEEGKFNGEKTLVENLYTFCKETLKFAVATKSNGMTPPEGTQLNPDPRRILLHPTSSREGKNWGQKRFLTLYDKLERRGVTPILLLTKDEQRGWDLEGKRAPLFNSLSELAGYVYGSGLLIGNDSGLGHLASCLGTPTLTLCRSAQNAKFWRPAWAQGAVLTPNPWIPNLKGLRLRDKYWQKWISVRKVLTQFSQLSKLSH
jgi:hypothetical protein